MYNYKIVVEYDGSNYSGWQKQTGRATIQQALEDAVFSLSGEHAEVVGSGRTDAGVSAVGQVANFKIDKLFSTQKLVYALNSKLPADISVQSAELASEDFSSRFSAKQKTYQYYFYTSLARKPLLDKFALKCKPLNIGAMQEACKYVVGTKDFTSFVAANSGKTDFVRTVLDCNLQQVADCTYRLEITGTGFLYNMVRIIMGTLIMIGEGKRTPEDMAKIIEAKNRQLAGKTVPAKGLVLKQVNYK